jgi:UDP-N-acetylmuramate dehydrogenase
MTSAILENVSLALYTTFKTGGVARYFVPVTTPDELRAAVDFAHAKQLPLFVLGSGSNVLVADGGYNGVVAHMQLRGVTYTDVSETQVEVTAAAGEVFDDVVFETTKRGIWGLENLSAIPGTVGATPVQNVGAYGVEVADSIVSVTVFNRATGGIEILTNAECAFGYRDSCFKHSAGAKYIITAVTFLLSRVPQPQLSYADLAALQTHEEQMPTTIREEVMAIRSAKFPDWSIVGTAGSFFKNPVITPEEAERLRIEYPALPLYPTSDALVKVSLGFILDKICGLRGYTKGTVGLYEKQALVLITERGTTTTEILSFADEVRERVFEKTHLSIEREVNLLQ